MQKTASNFKYTFLCFHDCVWVGVWDRSSRQINNCTNMLSCIPFLLESVSKVVFLLLVRLSHENPYIDKHFFCIFFFPRIHKSMNFVSEYLIFAKYFFLHPAINNTWIMDIYFVNKFTEIWVHTTHTKHCDDKGKVSNFNINKLRNNNKLT